MRHAPDDILEELRLTAQLDAVNTTDLVASDMVEWDAADYIERLRSALEQIQQGHREPVRIASQALDDDDWCLR